MKDNSITTADGIEVYKHNINYYADEYIPDMTDIEQSAYRKRLLRHEITHAFLNESGLQHCSSVPMGAWARHEEMVDWIAIQFPKIMKAFQEVGAL